MVANMRKSRRGKESSPDVETISNDSNSYEMVKQDHHYHNATILQVYPQYHNIKYHTNIKGESQ